MYFNVVITPGRNGDLSEPREQHSGGEAHEGYNGPFKEVQFSHQHIGGLCTLRDLFHKVQVHLRKSSREHSSSTFLQFNLMLRVESFESFA